MELNIAAYAAGLIDGEGSIQISKLKSRSKNDLPLFALVVYVRTSDAVIAPWLHLHWPGSLRLWSYNNKKAWNWQIAGRKAERFLQDIQPYLVLKQEQARLGLEFMSLRRLGPGLAESERAIQAAYYQAMKEQHVYLSGH